MQQILLDQATKGLTMPQERAFKNQIYFTSIFYLLIKYFAKAKPEKSKIPPTLQKEQLRGGGCFTVLKKGMCFHLPNTFIGVFMDIWRYEILPGFHLMSPSLFFFFFSFN